MDWAWTNIMHTWNDLPFAFLLKTFYPFSYHYLLEILCDMQAQFRVLALPAPAGTLRSYTNHTAQRSVDIWKQQKSAGGGSPWTLGSVMLPYSKTQAKILAHEWQWHGMKSTSMIHCGSIPRSFHFYSVISPVYLVENIKTKTVRQKYRHRHAKSIFLHCNAKFVDDE